MSTQPLVTIITPTFNQGCFIEATIKSVLEQTYLNIEYIVIDAMSTDETPYIVGQYLERINQYIREPDEGQSDAIVKGFRMARGELVGWINSDDILYPDCVERIVDAYLHNPAAVLFYNSKINIIAENGQFSRCVDVPVIDANALLRKSNTLIQPGSFYKNDALIAVGYFNRQLRFSMDLDLWLRLLRVGECVNVGGNPIAGYREWGGTKTATGDTKLLRERKVLLHGHGARAFDKTMLAINWALVKCFVKNFPIVGGVCKVLESLRKMILLILYYGLATHLPASNSRYTKWCRPVRRKLCSGLFRSAGKNINVEKGAKFGSGCYVSIGDNSGIGVDCQLMGDVSIGRNVMMGPDVLCITSTHDHSRSDVPMIEQGFTEEQPIIISDDVWIGARCTILPGVTIGKGVIIGAASVVTKNLPDYSVAVGNPATVIRSRLTANE